MRTAPPDRLTDINRFYLANLAVLLPELPSQFHNLPFVSPLPISILAKTFANLSLLSTASQLQATRMGTLLGAVFVGSESWSSPKGWSVRSDFSFLLGCGMCLFENLAHPGLPFCKPTNRKFQPLLSLRRPIFLELFPSSSRAPPQHCPEPFPSTSELFPSSCPSSSRAPHSPFCGKKCKKLAKSSRTAHENTDNFP